MEPGMYLFAVVLAVGVFHIACNVATFLTKKQNGQEKERGRGKSKQPKRDDWYMFFHRSDLIGKKSEKEEKTPSHVSSSNNRQKRSQRRSGARSLQA